MTSAPLLCTLLQLHVSGKAGALQSTIRALAAQVGEVSEGELFHVEVRGAALSSCQLGVLQRL